MAQESATKCDICKGYIGKVFCYGCRHFLCQTCNSWHEKFPATKLHTVTDSHNVDRTTLMLTFVCEDHKLEFCYFCQKCKFLICAQCVTSVHKGHSIRDITEVAAAARGDVQKRLGKIKENIKALSDLIEAFKTKKQTILQNGTDNFIKEVNEMSQDMIKIIESVTESNLTHASGFLILEKQQLLYNLAKLEKSFSEYNSMHERHKLILKEKHDVTFFLKQKSLAKEFELLDDIHLPEEPKEIGPLNRNSFVDSVIDQIRCKYGECSGNERDYKHRGRKKERERKKERGRSYRSISTCERGSSKSSSDLRRGRSYRWDSGSERSSFRSTSDRSRDPGYRYDSRCVRSQSMSSPHFSSSSSERDYKLKDTYREKDRHKESPGGKRENRYREDRDRDRKRDRSRESSRSKKDYRYKDRRYEIDRDRDRDRDREINRDRDRSPCRRVTDSKR
ncbi:luc7-like protein 3 isoform X12 [Mytilus californianus]|uniref:luc7-like protein 3 isoform X11 n=1 Tax=Mytilus californianus TaxID=6549 RepID=UPI0022471717|nr:luc7-like protein 3 isoform X11 [Mytilus californianus]XP_052078347.1 luc7-like protein 3 isoform X12 [Mytilus californianus]